MLAILLAFPLTMSPSSAPPSPPIICHRSPISNEPSSSKVPTLAISLAFPLPLTMSPSSAPGLSPPPITCHLKFLPSTN
ncbi:hypothetical protein BYT27DRAFT_6497570 [Phlegmacium glaucopus]|nr:hypothetical protein BYT27DRAFT_6497570 [Phlegmacium glaucopus]